RGAGSTTRGLRRSLRVPGQQWAWCRISAPPTAQRGRRLKLSSPWLQGTGCDGGERYAGCMANVTLDSGLSGVVGGRTAGALKRGLGLGPGNDPPWPCPRRPQRRGGLSALSGRPPGEHVTVRAQVLDVRSRSMRRGGKTLEVRITDGDGILHLTFFNQ